ncbi:uncharacterized protein EI97DRAFT_445870 [Westerdykella ornata]|uniref:Uncharacterized protein n=1 Tax=Westerdykella ornata TaxID=318751 RepID=A0A6A6J7Z4_WESOR|nr:uncharacterized protein EI97DRAFT_445870 [Westerdykella ornata]KAF2272283.1 hypothetical protein EI97DRAFT_445870 [Westerdykella ornata]
MSLQSVGRRSLQRAQDPIKVALDSIQEGVERIGNEIQSDPMYTLLKQARGTGTLGYSREGSRIISLWLGDHPDQHPEMLPRRYPGLDFDHIRLLIFTAVPAARKVDERKSTSYLARLRALSDQLVELCFSAFLAQSGHSREDLMHFFGEVRARAELASNIIFAQSRNPPRATVAEDRESQVFVQPSRQPRVIGQQRRPWEVSVQDHRQPHVVVDRTGRRVTHE